MVRIYHTAACKINQFRDILMELHRAVNDYLFDVSITKKRKTYKAYDTALRYFQSSCPKSSLNELDHRDIIGYISFLKGKGLGPRTIHNKFNCLSIFLKAHDMGELIKKQDWPKFTLEEPEVYSKEELHTFFSYCTPCQTVIFKMFLYTGLRESELIHMEQDDIDFKNDIIHIRAKSAYDFNPKTYKERDIPLHQDLKTIMTNPFPDWRKDIPDSKLVFPSGSGFPRTDLLALCKAIAKKAGLDPEKFWLHKFRSTFCTGSLRSGTDLSTVQLWMGHNNINTTMRYLAPQRGKEAQIKMNKIGF